MTLEISELAVGDKLGDGYKDKYVIHAVFPARNSVCLVRTEADGTEHAPAVWAVSTLNANGARKIVEQEAYFNVYRKYGKLYATASHPTAERADAAASLTRVGRVRVTLEARYDA